QGGAGGVADDASVMNDARMDTGDPNGGGDVAVADQSAEARDGSGDEGDAALDRGADGDGPGVSRPDAGTDAADATDEASPCTFDAGTGPGEDIWAPDI